MQVRYIKLRNFRVNGPAIFANGSGPDGRTVDVGSWFIKSGTTQTICATFRVNSSTQPGNVLTVDFYNNKVDITIPIVTAAPDGTLATIVNGPAKLYDRTDTGSAVLDSLSTGSAAYIQNGRGGMVWITYHGNTRAAWVREDHLRVGN